MRMRTTVVIDLTKDLDELWHNIKKSRRTSIKNGRKRGVVVTVNMGMDKEWLSIVRDLREFLGMPKHLPSSLKERGILFLAKLDGEVLAGNFFHKRGDRIMGRVQATKRFDNQKRQVGGFANALLTWEAIKWAKEQGYKEFDLGGYNEKTHPTVSFWKKSFGCDVCERPMP